MKNKTRNETRPHHRISKDVMRAKNIISLVESFFIEHFDPDYQFACFARSLAEAAGIGSDDPESETVDILLSLGFVVGQMFEPTDREVLEQIRLMKGLIRERRLLPIIPREKNAA